jgi:hypothetical protein
MASRAKRVPLHPGEVLREEFLKPLKLSASRLAQALDAQGHRADVGAAPRAGLLRQPVAAPVSPVGIRCRHRASHAIPERASPSTSPRPLPLDAEVEPGSYQRHREDGAGANR